MLKYLIFFSLILGCREMNAASQNNSKLNWMTQYEEAVSLAKNEQKPLLLFFTGSDWCGYCHQLDNEVFSSTEFSDRVGDKFIFVVLDFPRKTTQDPNIAAKNRQLQKQYDIKGFPTVILLNEQQQLIGVTGYRPGGAKPYAEHLLKMIEDSKNYQKKISLLPTKTWSQMELQALYATACQLCRSEDAHRIIAMGMQQTDNRFFLLKQFATLAHEGKMQQVEAQIIKQKLLKQDPLNLQKTHYEIAVIEFEAFSKDMEKEGYTLEMAIAPLIHYIHNYGENDLDNQWLLQMIIAQVFLDKNQIPQALQQAQSALTSAPQPLQPEIQLLIDHISRSNRAGSSKHSLM